jgi:hypothetical protein
MLTYYEYAALSKTPHALADGLMLVFQRPVKWVDLCFVRCFIAFSLQPKHLSSYNT